MAVSLTRVWHGRPQERNLSASAALLPPIGRVSPATGDRPETQKSSSVSNGASYGRQPFRYRIEEELPTIHPESSDSLRYRARDTRLDRSVAVKVLPSAFSLDSDRLHRFEHEARCLGALNHPNLLAIYDIGSQDGIHYLVSELESEGKNVPIATGTGNDVLLALLPDTGKFVVLRVPYRTGFYAKGMDGRTDDPKADWKGRALRHLRHANTILRRRRKSDDERGLAFSASV